MPKLLQINITANWGSHGKIAEGIGTLAQQAGWESHIAYGRWMNPSQSSLYRIGSMFDEVLHIGATRLFDNHGLMSHWATRSLNRYIRALRPDLIHLHNIHGYYLHYPLLFQQLKALSVPVVWTLHDCWPFTGHCAHYMYVQCNKWQSQCAHCPAKKEYPKSLFRDRSAKNFAQKKQSFLSLPQLTLVPVSRWLEKALQQSFLHSLPTRQIHNGIDLEVFRPQPDANGVRQRLGIAPDQKIILGVASNWYHKGLEQFVALSQQLAGNYTCVLVGVPAKEQRDLPPSVLAIERTENVEMLTALYTTADVFFNPTWEDNYPTTQLESIACGTPVVCFDTGGCGESIIPAIGEVIPQGDMSTAKMALEKFCALPKNERLEKCRAYAVAHFNKDKKFQAYLDLYTELLSPPTFPSAK